tara:strand:- start:2691 stop:3563 length:873 start_codon:yes stop_codon:yes gene_type:complete
MPGCSEPFLADSAHQLNWTRAFTQAYSITPWITPSAWKLVACVTIAQAVAGACQGTVGEIGVHHGSGIGLLGALADAGEPLWMLDIFEQSANIDHSGNGNETIVHETVLKVANRKVQTVLIMSSTALRMEHTPDPLFRMIHVDGSHLSSISLSDLRWASRALSPLGVLVLNDVNHKRWLGPGRATRAFFNLFDASYKELRPLAYSGKKLALCRTEAHSALRDALLRGRRDVSFAHNWHLVFPEELDLASADPGCRVGADETLARAEPPCALPAANFSTVITRQKKLLHVF